MHKDISEHFIIETLDNTHEGILWINLRNKSDANICYPFCVCYLPPEASSSGINANEFYDVLLSQVYRFQHLGSFTICGDFNSRLGQFTDYIADDNIPRRCILDKKTNGYGKLLQDFLISSETCILNGRNDSKDDFTSVSTKGLAVVDYVIVQHV